MSLKNRFDTLLQAAEQACKAHYGDRLLSIAVFGSVARGTMRPDSDIDLLLVIEPLPDGRMARMNEFKMVEQAVASEVANAAAQGVHTDLSPVFKTRAELEHGSLLFLDMTREIRILYDPDETLEGYLERLRTRLEKLGARRIRKGGGYYWLLKPDLRPGEDFFI